MDEVNPHLATFLEIGFTKGFAPSKPTQADTAVLRAISEEVRANVLATGRPRRYVLGLALDFVLLAQCISNFDQAAKQSRSLDEAALFKRYTLVTERGGTVANTLTMDFGGKKFGIRNLEERVIELFANLNRSGYPSAYVYNTGQWQKYKSLLVHAFNLSENGRYVACRWLVLNHPHN